MLPNWLYGKSLRKLQEILNSGGQTAAGVSYSNTESGLEATNAQTAIDEVVEGLNTKVGWDDYSELGAVNYLDNDIATQALDSISCTHNDDESLTFSGTSTKGSGYSYFNSQSYFTLKKGTYKISKTISNAEMYIANSGGTSVVTASNAIEKVFSISVDSECRLIVRIAAGATVNGTIYPMITPVSYNGPYVPYAPTNKQIGDDIADIAYEELTDYGSSDYTLTEGKMWQTKGVTFLSVTVTCNTVSPVSNGNHIKIAEIPSKFKKPQFNMYTCIANYKNGSTCVGAQLQIAMGGQIAIRGGEAGASYAGLFSF